MNEYDENGQLECLLTPCEKCAKLKKKNQAWRKKYNKEKRWASALFRIVAGDELTEAQEKEFGAILDKL